MTKEQLVAQIAEEANISKAAANAAIDSLTSIILNRANNGQETRLHGFGTFEARGRNARTGRNPQTGKAIEIAAKTVLAFKPSSTANDRLN